MLFDADTFATPPTLAELLPPPAATPVASGGRQAAWYVQGSYGAAVLRHYRRGGLIARFNRQHYLWHGAEQTRAWAEWRVLAKLYTQGLAVPRPLAAGYWRRASVFYTAAILTQRIPDVRTLAQALDHAPLEHIAQAIADLHQAGVWHADLNAHNILIDAQDKVWIIDFDRGRDMGASLPQHLRHNNLQRLQRSLEKVAGARGLALWHAVARAYASRQVRTA